MVGGGDVNTRIFHQSIRMSIIKSRINTIKNGNADWVSSTIEEVTGAFFEFLSRSFQEQWNYRSTRAIENSIIDKGRVLTEDEQIVLSLNFSPEEIRKHYFQSLMKNHQVLMAIQAIFSRKHGREQALRLLRQYKTLLGMEKCCLKSTLQP